MKISLWSGIMVMDAIKAILLIVVLLLSGCAVQTPAQQERRRDEIKFGVELARYKQHLDHQRNVDRWYRER